MCEADRILRPYHAAFQGIPRLGRGLPIAFQEVLELSYDIFGASRAFEITLSGKEKANTTV